MKVEKKEKKNMRSPENVNFLLQKHESITLVGGVRETLWKEGNLCGQVVNRRSAEGLDAPHMVLNTASGPPDAWSLQLPPTKEIQKLLNKYFEKYGLLHCVVVT